MKKMIFLSVLLVIIALNGIQMVLATDGADHMDGMVMEYDPYDLFNIVNSIAYPISILLTAFVAFVSFKLIKLTQQTDKFALVVIGMGFLFVQSIIGATFYLSHSRAITMTTVMFYSGILTTLAMISIGLGFYRWMKMLK